MSKGGDSKEFFEVFKAPGNLQDTQKKDVKPIEKTADAVKPQPSPSETEEKAVSKPGVSSDPLGWIRNTSTKDASFQKKIETSAPSKGGRFLLKDEVILRQETLVIGVIVAIFFSIACFFVGYKIGHNKGVMKQVEAWVNVPESQEDTKKAGLGQFRPVGEDQKTANKAVPIPQKTEKPAGQPGAVSTDKWTLRAISYRNTKGNLDRAKEVAQTIQSTLNYNTFIVDAGREILVCVGEFDARDSGDLIQAQKRLADFSYENTKPFKGSYPVRMR